MSFYIKNPARNVMWPSHVMVEGEVKSIADMYAAGEIVLEIRGRGEEGWAVYMSKASEIEEHPARAQQVSPLFTREQGDTRKMLIERAEFVYKKRVPTSVLAFHPARECWIFRTVEDPAVIEADAKVCADNTMKRFDGDVDGAREWIETEVSQNSYIINNTTYAPEVRDATRRLKVLRAALLLLPSKEEMQEIAAAEYEQEAATEEAARLLPSAADELAYWTLEAARKPDVPLYDNLDIPADVAEDIDARNWSFGSGLKNTVARRELFREKRAEAYARMYPDHAAELAAEKVAAAAAAAADIVAAHDAALEEAKANAEPFDPALVTITRKRFSTTQGEVLIEYDGQRIEQYGDTITMRGGEWVGLTDSYWMAVAKCEAVARGLAAAPTLADFQAIGRGLRVIEHKAELIEQAPAAWPIAVRIAFKIDSDNPNTIYNRLTAKLGRAPTNNEMRAEVCRIIAAAESGE